MSDTAPKRRWLRFSLRTLFVVVTLLCLWLGYQLNWIRQRQMLLEKHQALAKAIEPAPARGKILALNTYVAREPQTPGLLWLFGEKPRLLVQLIFLSDNTARELSDEEQQEIKRAESLFPEAKVTWEFKNHPATRPLPRYGPPEP